MNLVVLRILIILVILVNCVILVIARNMVLLAVPCESLVSREFSRIFFLFHFSISRHFHFTFHSRSRFQGIFISLFTLEMSERKNKFTFHFSKRVKAFQISLFFSRKKSELCMSCHEKFKKLIMYNTNMQQFHNGDSLFENYSC